MALVLHPSSKIKLQSIQHELPGSVLITGEIGVGLGTIARYVAGKDLSAILEPKDSKGESNHATGTIDVETIRGLYDHTRSKQTRRRIIIIDDADRMSRGAQAAFLKLLEEPTPHTHFILTSHSPQRILPTVRSRTQRIAIEPITQGQTTSLLDSLGVTDRKTRLQLEYIAAGLPAELSRLTTDSAYFETRAKIMSDTRTFLTGSAYAKLCIVHAYQQNKNAALRLIDSALLVTRRSLLASPQAALVEQLDHLLTLRERIEANHSVKLQLAAFVVQ